MTDYIKMGAPVSTGARRRTKGAEPLQFGDAEYVGTPVFVDVVHVVNPEHPELGELTYLPGEAIPVWLLKQDAKARAAAAEVQAEPVARRKGNRAVTAPQEEGLA